MTDKPFYSVIVPVYNVEPYLRPCLDSLLAQRDAPPWEAILVDDGSTDGSGAICDEYAGKYPNFQVLHVHNGGVSRARNMGMDAVRGEYALFLDSDDLLAAEALTTLRPILEKRPDMVVYSSQTFGGTESKRIDCPPLRPHKNETGDSYFRRCLNTGTLPLTSAWHHVFSISFLRRGGLRFQEGLPIGEDMDFTLECLSHAGSICGTEHVCYYYRHREGSASRSLSPEKALLEHRMLVKWFRRYPCSALADYYTMRLIGTSRLGTSDETKDIASLYKRNRDIPSYAGKRNMKIAAAFFRIFGLYRSSAVISRIIDVRNRYGGRPARRKPGNHTEQSV